MDIVNRAETAAPAADFTVSGGGSVYLVHPHTDDARNHLLRVVGMEAQFLGNAVAVEHRYIRQIVVALVEDGFTVTGEC
uniref:Smu18A n=1 Tax=uncultured organism TaxID=155900 RepID=Q0GNI6_9ZZZZ|nr:Smu18A [uncultured organism]